MLEIKQLRALEALRHQRSMLSHLVVVAAGGVTLIPALPALFPGFNEDLQLLWSLVAISLATFYLLSLLVDSRSAERKSLFAKAAREEDVVPEMNTDFLQTLVSSAVTRIDVVNKLLSPSDSIEVDEQDTRYALAFWIDKISGWKGRLLELRDRKGVDRKKINDTIAWIDEVLKAQKGEGI